MLSGMMRRLNLVLLASLQLCRARQPGFSIHDDMLAYPQVNKSPLSLIAPSLLLIFNLIV